MNDEEYQRRIDADPAVRRLLERTVREHQKEGMLPEERNPRGAGRKRGFEKLLFSDTEPLKVPKYEKETIKAMLQWLISIIIKCRKGYDHQGYIDPTV